MTDNLVSFYAVAKSASPNTPNNIMTSIHKFKSKTNICHQVGIDVSVQCSVGKTENILNFCIVGKTEQ